MSPQDGAAASPTNKNTGKPNSSKETVGPPKDDVAGNAHQTAQNFRDEIHKPPAAAKSASVSESNKISEPSAQNRAEHQIPANLLEEAVSILLTENLQPGRPGRRPVNHEDTFVDLDQKAKLQFAALPDGHPFKIDITRVFKQVMEAKMKHQDGLSGLPANERAGLAAFTLADGNDKECGELNRLIGIEYLPDVIKRNGRLLNPNDPADRPQWEKEVGLQAKIASLLLSRDDDTLSHPKQIHREQAIAEFRPFDEGARPPGLGHHLPDTFNAFGQKYEPQKLLEREIKAVLSGIPCSDLKPDERAVLATCREAYDQALPLSVLEPGNAAGEKILNSYLKEFQHFDLQLATAKLTPDQWYQCQQEALYKVPSTAQVMHFLTQQDAADLNPDQQLAVYQNKGYNTSRQTDAEILKESLRLAEWRYLAALETAVSKGLLFPQLDGRRLPAEATIAASKLPLPYQTRLRSVSSITNTNVFKDPDPSQDPGRILAMKQFRVGTGQPMSNPSGLDRDPKIEQQISDNLKIWNEFGFPAARVYIAGEQDGNRQDRLDALQRYRFPECSQYAKWINDDVEIGHNVVMPGEKRRAAEVERRRQNPQLKTCFCTDEIPPDRDPFINYTPANDAWIDTMARLINRSW